MKPRSRIISVRLSEEELASLQQFCTLTGARCVSDLVREAMRAMPGNVRREDLAGPNVQAFLLQIRALNRTVDLLVEVISSMKVNGTSRSHLADVVTTGR